MWGCRPAGGSVKRLDGCSAPQVRRSSTGQRLPTGRGVDEVGLGQIALNSAPVFGGLMLALAAGQFRGPDYRELIKQDMDLLDRLPPEATERRAELQRTIDARIDDLVDGADRSLALRRAALSYRGNWRDVVLFLCV